jgi:hypothetical protein
MKISGKVYMHITYTFIWWNHHRPPQQPKSENETFFQARLWISMSIVHVGHYLRKILASREARVLYYIYFDRMVHQVGLQPVLGKRRDIIWAGNITICCSCWLSFDPGWNLFRQRRKGFGLDWLIFFWCPKLLSQLHQNSVHSVFVKKTVCLHMS